MSDRPNGSIGALRHKSSVHDKRTGQIYYKPEPPPMQRVLKGGWIHKELPPQSDASKEKAI